MGYEARCRTRVLLVVFWAMLVGGCNAILGNDPHDLEGLLPSTDQDATTASDAIAAGEGSAAQDVRAHDATARDAKTTQDATELDGAVKPDGSGGSGDAGSNGEAPDAAVNPPSVSSATCVAGGNCSANDCQSGTWACVDGGRVCQTASAMNGTPCAVASVDAGSHVCTEGMCVSCNGGADCSDLATPCVKKSVDCTSGVPVCKVTGNAVNGVACGAGLYCNDGACAACQVGAACPPAANACHIGKVTACAGGVATCTDQHANASSGTSCAAAGGAGGVCDGSGSCAACSAGTQCNPGGNVCQVGVQSCSAGPQCANPVSVQEGKTCGAGKICHVGACGGCDGASCASGCCDSSGCVTLLQSITECGTGVGSGACAMCSGPSVGTGSAKCTSNACTFACAGSTPDACPGIGCVDLKNDDANCGQCGNRCGTSSRCSGGICTCTPKTAPCGNAVCGSATDGCGKTVTCPPGCTPPLSCDSAGQCVNTMCPTSCPMGDDCGSLSTPGCSTVTCGSGCTAPFACVIPAGSTAGTCKCMPKSVQQACASQQCGTASDGCETVTCPPGCGSGSSCHSGVCCPTACPVGAQCGSVATPGCPTLTCGPGCSSPNMCNASSGLPGTCVCQPTNTCGSQQCGKAPDGCGHQLSCGLGCTSPLVCDTSNNTCGCPLGTTHCGGACVNTSIDNSNCGGCGPAAAHVCPPADSCHTASGCSGGLCSAQQSLAMHTGMSLRVPGNSNFQVPACITSLIIDAVGAQGGSGEPTESTFLAPGGLGGEIKVTISVTPGEVLTVTVGQAGADDASNGFPRSPTSGQPGGGHAGTAGGDGGGYSSVSRGSTHLVIAGGGGGGQGASGAGGAGGAATGANGGCGFAAGFTCDTLATGGTQSAGGVANARQFVGGDGYTCPNGAFATAGGGGGYYGGGGACEGGGGGGSNFSTVTPSLNLQGGTPTPNAPSVNGSVTLTW